MRAILSRVLIVMIVLGVVSADSADAEQRRTSLTCPAREAAEKRFWEETGLRIQSPIRCVGETERRTSLKPKRLNASAQDKSVWVPEFDVRSVRSNHTQAEVHDMFMTLRDHVFLTDPDSPTRRRRLPWMYPDDGCFLRAHHAANLAAKKLTATPLNDPIYVSPKSLGSRALQKVFAFGSLTASSRYADPYSLERGVRWWYHVAPTTRVGNEVMVLDPAIEATRALTLNEWIAHMNPDPKSVRVSVCDGDTFVPNQPCAGAPEMDYAALTRAMAPPLRLEAKRVETLGLDPVRVLGDFPPWR
jgi:hypothetical protein